MEHLVDTKIFPSLRDSDYVFFDIGFGRRSLGHRAEMLSSVLVTRNLLHSELEAANILHLLLHLDGAYFSEIDLLRVEGFPVSEGLTRLLDELSTTDRFSLYCNQLRVHDVPTLEQTAALCRLLHPEQVMIFCYRHAIAAHRLLELIADGGRYVRRVCIRNVFEYGNRSVDMIVNVSVPLFPSENIPITEFHPLSVH